MVIPQCNQLKYSLHANSKYTNIPIYSYNSLYRSQPAQYFSYIKQYVLFYSRSLSWVKITNQIRNCPNQKYLIQTEFTDHKLTSCSRGLSGFRRVPVGPSGSRRVPAGPSGSLQARPVLLRVLARHGQRHRHARAQQAA